MTVRYVGKGGSDSNDGLSWANRKLTLNGVEDTPVVAGDTIYVGPGTYRELLTVDVDGSSGNPITYIGDVTGENTDGVGGIVRISGADDDNAFPCDRSQCIDHTAHSYRTFRGFYFSDVLGDDGASSCYIYFLGSLTATTNNIIEYCFFASSAQDGDFSSDNNLGIRFYFDNNSTSANNIIRNCVFMPTGGMHVAMQEANTGNDCGLIVENNIFYGAGYESEAAVWINKGYGVTIRGNTFVGYFDVSAIYSVFGVDSNYNDIYDNRFINSVDAMDETVTNTLNEDYNFLDGSGSSVSEGANSITSFLPQTAPILRSGFRFPWTHADIGTYNDNIYMSDNEALTKDVYGLARPGSGKRTRGGVQFKGVTRDSTEYRKAPSSMRMDDASKHIVSVPIKPGQGKISVTIYVKRETNYAGTNPQLVLNLPTQSAVTTTDTGSSGVYNRLTASVTPGESDRWLQIEFRSNNTATTGDYAVWFDELKVSARAQAIPQMKWITNEIPLFCFSLDRMVDPWITPTTPVPYIAPVYSQFHPLPTFRL